MASREDVCVCVCVAWGGGAKGSRNFKRNAETYSLNQLSRCFLIPNHIHFPQTLISPQNRDEVWPSSLNCFFLSVSLALSACLDMHA